MKKDNAVSRWVWWLSLIVCGVIVFKLADDFSGFTESIGNFAGVLTPFIIGFIITFLLYAPCNRLELWIKKSKNKILQKTARAISMTVCYLVFFALITGVLVLLLPALYRGITALFAGIPTYYNSIAERVQTLTEPGGLVDRLGLSEAVNNAYAAAYDKLLSMANPSVLLPALTGMFKGVLSVTSSLFDVFMALIVSVYMLAQREALLRALKALLGAVVGKRALGVCTYYVHQSAAVFYNYLYGASVDVVVVAVLLSIGFSIFGMPQAVLLGCVVGLMNFIPYFGAIIGGAGVALIALLTHNIYYALGLLAFVIIIQQVDGNIIQPRIVGSTVGLRPIYVLLAITVGGGLFGFWGMLIGVPIMAIIKVVLTDFIQYRNKQKQQTETTETT